MKANQSRGSQSENLSCNLYNIRALPHFVFLGITKDKD